MGASCCMCFVMTPFLGPWTLGDQILVVPKQR